MAEQSRRRRRACQRYTQPLMSKVIAIMSMSLDGYVADLNDGVAEVFHGYASGDVEIHLRYPVRRA